MAHALALLLRCAGSRASRTRLVVVFVIVVVVILVGAAAGAAALLVALVPVVLGVVLARAALAAALVLDHAHGRRARLEEVDELDLLLAVDLREGVLARLLALRRAALDDEVPRAARAVALARVALHLRALDVAVPNDDGRLVDLRRVCGWASARELVCVCVCLRARARTQRKSGGRTAGLRRMGEQGMRRVRERAPRVRGALLTKIMLFSSG